jgi:hypothetical protein
MLLTFGYFTQGRLHWEMQNCTFFAYHQCSISRNFIVRLVGPLGRNYLSQLVVLVSIV